jgi:hypothetical protein
VAVAAVAAAGEPARFFPYLKTLSAGILFPERQICTAVQACQKNGNPINT